MLNEDEAQPEATETETSSTIKKAKSSGRFQQVEAFGTRSPVRIDPEADNYRQGVELLFGLKSSTVIANGKSAHAAILFEKFFEHAKQKVRIFCQDLNPEVFAQERVIAMAEDALSRGVEIKVITQNPPKESRFLDLLLSQGQNASVQIVAGHDQGKDSNFAVMDTEAFRVEPNRRQLEARAVMFDPSYAKGLVDLFDRLPVMA